MATSTTAGLFFSSMLVNFGALLQDFIPLFVGIFGMFVALLIVVAIIRAVAWAFSRL